jgi:predicted permease
MFYLPLFDGGVMGFTIEGQHVEGTQTGLGAALHRPIGGDYFKTLEIPLLRGRAFDETDRHDSELVAVINEAAAKRYWPDEDALGKRIHMGLPDTPDSADPVPRRIVGIARNVREAGLGRSFRPVLYYPLSQTPARMASMYGSSWPLAIAVRTEYPPEQLAKSIQAAIWKLAPHQPITDVRLMTDHVASTLGSQEFNMLLLGLLAGVALLLAAVGIHGVLAYLVSQRTREIGIRMALGAGRRQIVRLVLFQWMKAASVGILVGLVGAFATTRFLSSLLSGVSTTDAVAFTGVPLLFLMVALAATYFPARRAARVNPTTALRWE